MESINKTYKVHYSTTQLGNNNFCVQLVINEHRSEQMVLSQEETASFLRLASKHGFIADKIAF